MAHKSLGKSPSGSSKSRNIGLGLLAGFIMSLAYMSPSIYYSSSFRDVSAQTIAPSTSSALSDHSKSSLNSEEQENKKVNHANEGSFIETNKNSSAEYEANNDRSSEQSAVKNTHELPLVKSIEDNRKLDGPTNDQLQTDEDLSVSTNSTSSTMEPSQTKVASNMDQLVKSIEENRKLDDPTNDQLQTNGDLSVSPNSTSSTTEPSQMKVASGMDRLDDDDREDAKPKDTKITCDVSYGRSDRCEMDGDIRIHGKSGSITFISASTNETWQVKPYARRGDLAAMGNVRELSVKPSQAPHCAVNHSVPAVVFSGGGYVGNFFHDLSDVLIPLFQTTYRFDREVQFLVTDRRTWWTDKYELVLNQLSRYELIDLDNDDRVHCFARATVGLDSDDDLRIDTSRSANGYSMVDFGRMLRVAFSLPRAAPVATAKKPRLLIVARAHTRRLTNVDEVVAAAEKAGYEVVAAEPEYDLAKFARIVNSCDVMMGVHGAGLTNFVFLPMNAVVIQIVPWGNLDWIASNYYEKPPRAMGLKYLEYKIVPEESTLSEIYPADDPVFTDPSSIHKQGWEKMREIFLVKQNVKLNVERFAPVLTDALMLLRSRK